jgi:nucleotide-binding universal stress UspA family protein
MQKQQQKRMGEEAAWVKKEFGIEVDSQVRLGIASDEIRHLVSENAIDLVVMGMKGENGVEKMIGSTTTNVVRKIKTPVLIVPQDATYQPLDRIVYATDFSYKGTHHLFDPLLALIRKFSATVQILHITLSHSSEHPDTLMGKKEIEQIFQPVSHAFVNLEHSSVTQGVNEFLSSHPSSLLVMVAHRHTFFERIFAKNHTTAMAYETHLPLLVLQDKG